MGRSALEAVAPDDFGGMSIEWTAEGGRWVVRSNSAPALFPNAPPPAKKVGLHPQAMSGSLKRPRNLVQFLLLLLESR